MENPDPEQHALFAGYLPPEDPDRGSKCECCPHAASYEAMVRDAITTNNRLHNKLLELKETVERAALHIRHQNELRAQDMSLLEEFAMEKYDMQQELNAVHEEYATIQSKYEDLEAFVSVLGWSKRVQTTDDKRRPSR